MNKLASFKIDHINQNRHEQTIATINRGCVCSHFDRDMLRKVFDAHHEESGLFEMLEKRCPTMFAAHSVLVLERHLKKMAQVVQAIESVVTMASFRRAVLSAAPAVVAHHPAGAKSVFMGYDFHVRDENVGLIEINTNAGGAMLNAALISSHEGGMLEFEQLVVNMFRSEWRLSGHSDPLRTIAIVDMSPEQQYFYPEFLMFQRLFQKHGLKAIIAAPSEFSVRDGRLWHENTLIDMVYNRLTDFLLETPECAAIRQAHLENAVVLTPHPQTYALYADKRILSLLCNADWLTGIGVSSTVQAVLLAHIPFTENVNEDNVERLWATRKNIFFKPTRGYGSRGVFRGDKLTKKSWSEIVNADYVAQNFVVPGEQIVQTDDVTQTFKFDVRNYAYGGNVQLVAARMYQGLRTNFRTPGSGFSRICNGSGHNNT